ncbi:O-antigen ligase family protein [Tepidibacter mesophilus]|uniref:O-antigen ligase family protein n=1 Tax=Tepidibacter mesophilus TaxID=655607 RepID=UPI0011AF139D|nr:O-antigen ligase family protein [Tepidibacter mesophilus]
MKNERKINKILYIYGFVLFMLPFFKGLYFEKDMYIAALIIGVLSLISLIRNVKKEDGIILFSGLQYSSISFITLYIITCFFAFNKDLATYEATKNLTYFLLFISISYEIKNTFDISFLSISLILSGVVVSMIGFGCAFGSFTYEGAFQAGMINSTFQYHNTFGAYMLGILFLTMSEICDKEGVIKNILNGIGYLIFLGFIFSYSRGAWVLLPVCGFIMLVLLRNKGFKNVILSTISILISFGITFSNIYNNISTPSSKGWIFILIGIVVSFIVSLLLDKLFSNIEFNKKIIISILVCIAFLGAISLFTGALSKFLPENISQRIQSINAKSFTVVERGVFYKDGLKMVKEHPVLGAGGGAWASLYNQYKTYEYTTQQAHNYIMQVWTDIGTLGLISLIGIYLSLVIATYKSYIKIEDSRLKNRLVCIFTAAIALIAHSFIDFDMSLGAYAVILWIILGIILSLQKEYCYEEPKKKKEIISIPKVLLVVLTVIVMASSLGNRLAFVYSQKAIDIVSKDELKAEDYRKVAKYFKTASTLDPFKATYKFDLGNTQLYMAEEDESKKVLEESKLNVEKSLKLDETNYKVLTNAAQYYFRIGETDKALQVVEKLEEYHPLNDYTYTNVIGVNYSIAGEYLNNKEFDKAKPYLQKIVDTEETVLRINNELNKKKEDLLKGVKDLPEGYVEDRFNIKLTQVDIDKINASKEILNSID